MKHIITGGDGFLGTELARKLLARGEEVVIADIKKSDTEIYPQAKFVHFDITQKAAFDQLEVDKNDVIYHFAARLLVPIMPRSQRRDYFWSVLYHGTENLLEFMEQRTECRNIVYYTTDMVYGHTELNPRFEAHPRKPVGPYGDAKYHSELLCDKYREKGFKITIFRPRLIIGPGRLGILESLFKLIDKNLPVPMIGNGKNYYQFVSVSDCADTCIKAFERGIPNTEYNVGSLNPPTVRELLTSLIEEAGSKSILVPTPAPLVKFALGFLDRIGMPLMDPEQYLIADETCVLDVSKAERELDWVPKDNDSDMLISAYRSYRERINSSQVSEVTS